MIKTVRVPVNLLTDRLDVRYNSFDAILARKTIAACGLQSSEVGLLFDELVCGPFGSTLTADEHSENGEVLLIQPTNINAELFSLESSWRIKKKTLLEKNLSLYSPDTFLFARVGVYPHVGVLPEWAGLSTISSSMIAAIPNGKVDSYYLLAFFRSKYGLPLLFAAQKVTAQPTIGTSEIANTVVPIPKSLVQNYIADKVRLAERLRERSRELEQAFNQAIQRNYPEIFGDIKIKGKHSRAIFEELDTNLNPGLYNPERLRIRRYLNELGCKKIQDIATIETPTSDNYHPEQLYIGLEAISSSSLMITPSTIRLSEVKGAARVLSEGSVISKLRPYLNKVTYIPSEFDGALGSTELLCVKPKKSVSGWFLYGVLKLESSVRQLNPAATGDTHPRISREDILDLLVPWLDESTTVGDKLKIAQEAYFLTDKLTTAAKLLVEALIEGKITEDELKTAQQALEKGDREPDKTILSRLTHKGIDIKDEPPLFPDLEALYELIDQLIKDRQEE